MGVRPHIPAEGRRLYSSVVQPQRVLQRAPQSTENPEPTAAAPQPLIDFTAGLEATPSDSKPCTCTVVSHNTELMLRNSLTKYVGQNMMYY